MPTPNQFALYSPLLPPAHGGQPAILQRILESLDPQQYYLIGDKRYQNAHSGLESQQRLAATTTLIENATRQPEPDFRKRGIATFPFYASREIISQAHQIARRLREAPPGVLVVCTGNFYGFAAACLAGKLSNVPVIPYIFDDYSYQTNRKYRVAARLFEHLCIKGSAGLIVTNEAAATVYKRRYGVAGTVIYNSFDKPDLEELDSLPNPLTASKFNIVYAGSIYQAHYDAFRNLSDAIQKPYAQNIRLHLFTPHSPEQLAAKGISGPQVIHHGLLKGRELLAAERKADLLFMPLAFETPLAQLLKTAAPGKTAEYLALERPILVHAPPDTFLSQYFARHECGLVVDRNDVGAVGQALERIMNDKELCSRIARNGALRYQADFRVDIAQSRFLKTMLDARDTYARNV